MPKLEFYEPAMCCETGLCGPSLDPELLRVSTAINKLKAAGADIGRYNLNNAPMQFATNMAVNTYIKQFGTEKLPLILLDGSVRIAGRYPTNEEFCSLLGLSPALLAPEKADEQTETPGCGGSCK